MRYTIEQTDDGQWSVTTPDGSNGLYPTYAEALAIGMPGMGSASDGLLPETWTSPIGIAFSTKLPGGRDFTSCAWSWRDPSVSLVPLMLLTETSMGGHLGAQLAGYVETFTQGNGTVQAQGRFYDSETGAQARDLLLGGRAFGVSVDPSEKVDVTEDFTCTQTDDEGFCIDGDLSMVFNAYEIAGLTMCPIPGFENAAITLAGGEAFVDGLVMGIQKGPAAISLVRASSREVTTLSIPTIPPREWMTLEEPAPGTPFLDGVGDDVLIEQTDRAGNVQGFACPLTIRDDGLVYGHLTYWGQCHTGNPWGPNACASAQPSKNDYRDFHASGEVICDDGTHIPTGQLVVGCEHSDSFTVAGVRDHLAHAGMGWASVHVVDGQFGPWLCGVLRPDLTENQVRILRSLSLSGEWVGELGGILAVNASGLPVQRERLAASAQAEGWTIPSATLRSSARNGEQTRLVGANIVRRCPECTKRAAMERMALKSGALPADLASNRFDRIEQMLGTLERRTRHLVPVEAEVRASALIPNPDAAIVVPIPQDQLDQIRHVKLNGNS